MSTYISGAFEAIPQLNTYLELVSLPSDEFRVRLLSTLGLSVFGSFLWDRIIVAIFSPKLMWIGYVDAYNALPTGKDMVGFWKNVGLMAAAGCKALSVCNASIICMCLTYCFCISFILCH